MAIITLPTINASLMDLRLIRGDQPLEFFDGSVVVVQSNKAIWICSFSLDEQLLATARAWQAALVQLAKPANQFDLTPPGWVPGAEYTGANPLVNGTSQLGLSLVCDGAAINDTVSLAGDFISVNGEFKCLTQQADSDGSGNVTFNFEPALRTSPADGATVEVIIPVIRMRLLSPIAAWAVSAPDIFNINIDAVEHFGP